MSVTPFTAGRFRAFDSNGAPLAGGLLYTYAAGTTTPRPTYTDSTGVTPNANPVVLDASGYADIWLNPALGNYKLVLQNSLAVVQWTVDNFPPAGSSSGGGGTAGNQTTEPGGRLSLTAATPVTNTNVTGATTIYYSPYRHDQVPLYDGAAWSLFSIGAGISQTTTDSTKSPAAVANNSNYDLFVWNDAGTIRLSRGPAWTSDTARGSGVGTTEITQQNGKYVNKNAITNGPASLTGLYVGTVRSDGSAHINDSLALRCVWNNYNRVARPMSAPNATGNYTYVTTSYRQAHADAANQLALVVGSGEDAVTASVIHSAFLLSGTNIEVGTAIGLDSTTAPASGCITSPVNLPATDLVQGMAATWEGFISGYHYLAFLEYGGANVEFTGTTTPPLTQTGIQGTVMG